MAETFPVLNLTREEFRSWKRAREYHEVDPKKGYLGKWVIDTFGREAWLACIHGGCVCRHGADILNLPRPTIPRVQYLTMKEIEEMHGRIEDEEA